MAEPHHIRELKIEVNRECPLRCLHCSSNGAPKAPEKLDPTRVADLIREFADLGGKALVISGGEPLLYRDLPLLLGVCRALGICPSLYTTGVTSNETGLRPISDDALDLLGQSRAKLVFSLHGAHARTHDSLTQVAGSFDTTIEAIERTLVAGISAEVHFVPTAINFGEVVETVDLLASMGIRKVSWLRFVPQGRGAVNRRLLKLSKEQLRQLAHVRANLQRKHPEVQIRTGSPFNILLPQCPTPCSAGLGVLAIRPDGSAIPCDAFKQFGALNGFGNIREHSLRDVWERSDLLNMVREIQHSRHGSSCATCPAYTSCGAGCLAQTALAAGRLTEGKDPDCLLLRAEVASGAIEAVPVY